MRTRTRTRRLEAKPSPREAKPSPREAKPSLRRTFINMWKHAHMISNNGGLIGNIRIALTDFSMLRNCLNSAWHVGKLFYIFARFPFPGQSGSIGFDSGLADDGKRSTLDVSRKAQRSVGEGGGFIG